MIRKASGLDIIRSFYRKILKDARQKGLSENIEIHLGPKAAKELDLQNSLSIDRKKVPVVIENGILERKLENDGFSSDIYIFDPDWLEYDNQG